MRAFASSRVLMVPFVSLVWRPSLVVISSGFVLFTTSIANTMSPWASSNSLNVYGYMLSRIPETVDAYPTMGSVERVAATTGLVSSSLLSR